MTAYTFDTKYNNITTALTALNNLPTEYKKGGMGIKFINSSDNKYVQYRLMSNTFSTTESDWQGIDDEPKWNSLNLVKSGGVISIGKDSLSKGFILVKNYILEVNPDRTSRFRTHPSWDCLFFMLNGQRKIEISGFSGTYRFANTADLFTGNTNPSSSYIGNNTTGVVLSGAVICFVNIRHSDNIDYTNLRIISEWDYVKHEQLNNEMQRANTAELFASRGFYIDYNHLMNISVDEIKYKENSGFDCLLISLEGKETNINVEGLLTFSYRFFNSLDIFSGNNVIENKISTNTTGVVPSGAKICVINIDKNNNPVDYEDIRIVKFYDYIDYNTFNNTDGIIIKKNLIDKDNLLYGYLLSEGQWVENTNGVASNKMEFKDGWNYAFQNIRFYGASNRIFICHFDSSDNFIGSTYVNATFEEGDVVGNAIYTYNSGTISGTAYCRVILKNAAITIDFTQCQIEVGSEYTEVVGYNEKYEVRQNHINEVIEDSNELVSSAGIFNAIESAKKISSKGLYIIYNHLMSIDTNYARYQKNLLWDCIIIVLSGQKNITIDGVNVGNYRFFDSLDIFTGENVYSNYIGYNAYGKIPDGAKICIINVRKSDNPEGYDNIRLINDYTTGKANKKKIRLLSIGNSYSDDALAYVPFIIQNMGVDADVQIGILMQSSSPLEWHVDNFENETAAYSFRLFDGGSSWNQMSGTKTIQWALDNYEWDIISLQQSSQGSFTWNTYQPWANKLINLISAYIDYPVKFIWYQPQARPASTNSGANWSDEVITQHYESTVEASKLLIEGGVKDGVTILPALFEKVVPVGTAIQNARSIAVIKVLGDYANNQSNTSGLGYLTPNDGVHLQEGLPCQIAAYTFILSLLDLYGFSEWSINGESTRVTSEWVSGKNIPSPHGTPIGSNDANCLIAQKCAIMAIRHPFEVTDMNYIVNPT